MSFSALLRRVLAPVVAALLLVTLALAYTLAHPADVAAASGPTTTRPSRTCSTAWDTVPALATSRRSARWA